MDTTPLWLIAAFAAIMILSLIYLEIRKQRKSPNSNHYFTLDMGNPNEKAHAAGIDFLNPNKYPTPEEQESYLAGPRTMEDVKREVYEQRSKRA